MKMTNYKRAIIKLYAQLDGGTYTEYGAPPYTASTLHCMLKWLGLPAPARVSTLSRTLKAMEKDTLLVGIIKKAPVYQHLDGQMVEWERKMKHYWLKETRAKDRQKASLWQAESSARRATALANLST